MKPATIAPLEEYFTETWQRTTDGSQPPTPAEFVGATPADPSDEAGSGTRSPDARQRRACAQAIEQACRAEVESGLAVECADYPGAFIEIPKPPSCPTPR